MTVTDIADDVQAQFLSATQVVQDTVVTTLEWLTEQAQSILPETAARIADRLPQAKQYVDRGFEAAEQWLRSQHEFASKVAGAVQPTA
jgi:hypothetical protein